MNDLTRRPIPLGEINELRYGENARQGANFFTRHSDDPLELGKFLLIEGKIPSYTNMTDLHRALYTLNHFVAAVEMHTLRPTFCAVAVKHGNPCGAGYGTSPQIALERMILGDTLAIFGGIVITNFNIEYPEAQTLLYAYPSEFVEKRVLDMVIAPGISTGAAQMLRRRESRCIMLTNPALVALSEATFEDNYQCRGVRMGYLVQDRDTQVLNFRDPRMQIFGERLEHLETDFGAAAALCRTSNSNTITLFKDGMLLGQGVAQTSRVRAAQVALLNATESGHKARLKGCVAVSDSFFPFDDGPKILMEAGVSAIFATSGSVNDEQVRKAVSDQRRTLYQLPDSVARMFFGH